MSYSPLKTQDCYAIKWNDIGKHKEISESLTRFNYGMEWTLGFKIKYKCFLKNIFKTLRVLKSNFESYLDAQALKSNSILFHIFNMFYFKKKNRFYSPSFYPKNTMPRRFLLYFLCQH